MITVVSIAAVAYLLGSLSPSLLVARLYGVDIRRHGSGNPGATNVLRVVGWKPALGVLAADVGKGFVAAGPLARMRLGDDAWALEPLQLMAGACALAGHVWPVLAGFRGGKAVATAAGVVLAVYPLALLPCVAVFVVVASIWRRVSPASLAASATLPLALWLARAVPGAPPVSGGLLGFGVAVLVLVVFTHRSNLRNLLAGREPRIGGRGWRG